MCGVEPARASVVVKCAGCSVIMVSSRMDLSRANAPRLSVADRVWCTFTPADVYSFSARQAELVLAEPSAEGNT